MAAVQRLPILIAVALSSLATPGGLSGGAIEFDYAANSLGERARRDIEFRWSLIYETIATFPLDNLLFQHVLLYVPQGNQAHLLFGTCLTGGGYGS